MARISTAPVKGARDFLPRDLAPRNRVFQLMRDTFERYGYEPLETPAIEHSSALEGKYGEEGERLLFRILKNGRDLESAVSELDGDPGVERSAGSLARRLSEMALRYDLTVPMARVIAAHQNDIVTPFRRYQMQPVWRGDRPQRGRYREFYQCDVDCVGSRSMIVDAEMVAIHHDVFARLGFQNFVTQVSHRGLLDALMEASGVAPEQRVAARVQIDKFDKIGAEGVREELKRIGLAERETDALLGSLSLTGAPLDMLAALRPLLRETEQGETSIDELEQVFDYIQAMGVPQERYELRLSMVRGSDYYTGSIYETVLPGSGLGTLGAGGRYDKLVGMFLGRDIPAVGISFGVERILVAMADAGLLAGAAITTTQALVTLFGPETANVSFTLAQELRAAGVRTEIYPDAKGLGPQLAFASKKGIPLAFIIGPDEAARGDVKLRDLRSREERTIPQAEAPLQALAHLAE
ncbi:MAG TPA: histidine--tRNA ligase [Ktedonobacterales bacterium]|jgi:histidyl-tRNA synthetase|nr:histidine--tRNA ligase [Ktedonobacterales bacterium]